MADETRHLQSVDTTIAAAVSETLTKLDLMPEDAAAKRLAMRYAQGIDAAAGREHETDVLKELGPKLLAVLVELGATPKARSAVMKPNAPTTASPLSKMRSQRSTA